MKRLALLWRFSATPKRLSSRWTRLAADHAAALHAVLGYFGHHDFTLCPSCKAIRTAFRGFNPSMLRDCVISQFGKNIEMLDPPSARKCRQRTERSTHVAVSCATKRRRRSCGLGRQPFACQQEVSIPIDRPRDPARMPGGFLYRISSGSAGHCGPPVSVTGPPLVLGG